MNRLHRTIIVTGFSVFVVGIIAVAIRTSPHADELTPKAKAQTNVVISGTMEIIGVDNFKDKKKEHHYYIRTDDGQYVRVNPDSTKNLHATTSNAPHATTFKPGSEEEKLLSTPTGTRVTIKGKAVDDVVTVIDKVIQTKPSVHASATEKSRTTGTQRVAVLVANFASNPTVSFSTEDVRKAIFNGSDSVQAFYAEQSNSLLDMTGDVFGWYTIDAPNTGIDTCDYIKWMGKTKDQARLSGVNLENYDYYSLVIPGMCDAGGLGISKGSDSWIFYHGTLSRPLDIQFIFAHEFGHNLGVGHSNRLMCPKDNRFISINDTSCHIDEYGDYSDVMGASFELWHMNSAHKDILGWLKPENITTVTASGTYKIVPIDITTESPQALLIHRGQDSLNGPSDYYLDFRSPSGFDKTIDRQFLKGLAIRLTGPKSNQITTGTQLIMPPTQNRNGVNNITWRSGQTFTDPMNEMKITVKQLTATEASIEVEISPNIPPSLSLTNLEILAPDFTISYSLQDPDNYLLDSARIRPLNFYLDTNNTEYNTDHKIWCYNDPNQYSPEQEGDKTCGGYLETDLPNGTYYVFGVADDGINAPVKSYATGKITLSRSNFTLGIPYSNPPVSYSVGQPISVNYTLTNPDTDVTASLYYIRINQFSDNVGNELEAKGCLHIAESENGACAWQTGDLQSGLYMIYGRTNPGNSRTTTAYLPGLVRITPTASPKLTIIEPKSGTTNFGEGTNATLKYTLEDSDGDSTASFYIDQDGENFDGSPIPSCQNQAIGTEKTCIWEVENLAPGTYSVYGVASDKTNHKDKIYAPGKIKIDLAKPTNLSMVSNSRGRRTISWVDNSKQERNYQIWRSVSSSNSSLTLYKTLPANTTSFTDSEGITKTGKYFYLVRAIQKTGTQTYVSEFSNKLSVNSR